jgi:hypothetical protein
MRFFDVLDFQYLILTVFLGAAVLLIIYLGFRSYSYSWKEGPKTAEEEHEYPGGLKIGTHPIPPLLIFLFIGFVVWFFIYVIFYGLRGGPF